MGKIYTEVFKKRALSLLSELNEKRSVKVDKQIITNVRDLVKALGISKDSIYNWRKQISPEKKQPEKKKRKGTIRHEKFKKEQAELLKQKEMRLRIKDLEKELSKLNQLSGRDDPKVKQKIREKVKEITKAEKEVKKAKKIILSEEELALVSIGKAKEIEEELPGISGTMDIFGGRFVGSIAQAMGITNYSRMKLKQLLLKVGQVYVQKSGLSRKEGK